MKTALVSFLYPKARPYWPDAFQSITQQTDKAFDMIVVNDGYGTVDPTGIKLIIDNDLSLSPILLRQHVFNLLMDSGYDLLISLDPDDTMSVDRVEKTKKAYKGYPEAAFYYSSLNYMAEPGKAFFDLPVRLDDVGEIFYRNYVGLSHMSLNLKFLRQYADPFSFPDKIIALDWYLAVSMLLEGFYGRKTFGTTYYRIYGDNLAGETSKVSFDKSVHILKVKIAHYEAIEGLIEDQRFKDACASELTRLKALMNGPHSLLKDHFYGMKADTTNYWWAGY
ncbi:glycosyltransferase family protein [Kordiimonas aquimaris]|uniref:hypothetical protein n=1 Tax=Kordiimonas aquimaris TaxID=707591 RepID=UPI0021CE19A4|nr:hypothetical protein [Kordiimonas aquimaris]